MDIHEIFLLLFVILFLSRIIGDLFYRLGIPDVLGYILLGIVIGKSFLGLVDVNDIIKILAEIGIILLLFSVGLEADFDKLKKVLLSSIVIGFLGCFLPLILGFFIMYYVFKYSIVISLFVGGTLAATSIGITVKVLDDLGKLRENFSQIFLGAAIIDDILGVIILAILYQIFSVNSFSFMSVLVLISKIFIFFIFSPILVQFLVKIIEYVYVYLGRDDFIQSNILAIVLLFAYLSYRLGSPEILGAFITGLAISRRFYVPFLNFLRPSDDIVHKVEKMVVPLIWILVPIFFVSIGLKIDLSLIDFFSFDFWKFSLVILLGAVISKILVGFFIKIPFKEKLLIGFCMLPRGEVGLIFCELAKNNKIFDDFIYTVMVFVIAFTTLIAPFFIKIILKK